MNGLNARGQQSDLARRTRRRLLRAACARTRQPEIGGRINALVAVSPADTEVVDVCPADFERRGGTIVASRRRLMPWRSKGHLRPRIRAFRACADTRRDPLGHRSERPRWRRIRRGDDYGTAGIARAADGGGQRNRPEERHSEPLGHGGGPPRPENVVVVPAGGHT